MHSSELGVIKSGVLEMVSFDSKFTSKSIPTESFQKTNQRKVLVVVYKTSLEHFAIVYPHWGLITAKRPFCIINLKRARVERSHRDPDHEFSVQSYRDASFLSLVLCTTEKLNEKSEGNNFQSIDSWINALQGEFNDSDNKTRHQWSWSSKRRVSKSSLLSVLNEDSEEYGI
jgi:hypothetical protein